MFGRTLRAPPRGASRPRRRGGHGGLEQRTALPTQGAVLLTGRLPVAAVAVVGPSALVWGTYPVSGIAGVTSTPFTIGANGPVVVNITVTPSDGGGGGSFIPTARILTTAAPSGTFTYTPSITPGVRAISVTNNQPGVANPAPLTYTSTSATAITLTGPTSGTVSVASSNFTIGANGPVGTSIVVTMSDNAGGGTFKTVGGTTITTVTLTTAAPSQTFTYTPGSTGAKTISLTSNPVLTYPSPITYTSNAAGGAAASWPGTVRTAASASQADVQTAVNASSDGDVVQIPNGTV